MIIIRMKWAVNGTFLTDDFELKKDVFLLSPIENTLFLFIKI